MLSPVIAAADGSAEGIAAAEGIAPVEWTAREAAHRDDAAAGARREPESPP